MDAATKTRRTLSPPSTRASLDEAAPRANSIKKVGVIGAGAMGNDHRRDRIGRPGATRGAARQVRPAASRMDRHVRPRLARARAEARGWPSRAGGRRGGTRVRGHPRPPAVVAGAAGLLRSRRPGRADDFTPERSRMDCAPGGQRARRQSRQVDQCRRVQSVCAPDRGTERVLGFPGTGARRAEHLRRQPVGRQPQPQRGRARGPPGGRRPRRRARATRAALPRGHRRSPAPGGPPRRRHARAGGGPRQWPAAVYSQWLRCSAAHGTPSRAI